MRALGIDLGSKRIGIAVSDSAGVLASAVDTVHRTGDRPREHREILRIGREFEVEALVVGVPYTLDGEIGPAAQAILAEVAELAATTDLPVETYDERLTTVTADRLLQEQGLDAKERRRVVDKVAAAILLQAWLDNRHLTASDQEPSEHQTEEGDPDLAASDAPPTES